MGCKWNKSDLFKMLSKPESRKDLWNLFVQQFDSKSDGLRLSPKEVLEKDKTTFEEVPSVNNYLCAFDKTKTSNPASNNTRPVFFSRNDALEITNSYYKSLNGPTYSIFKPLFDKREDTLKFVSNTREIGSKTIPCPSTGETYMYVNYDGTINGVLNLIHEYAHAIGYQVNPVEERKEYSIFFGEIESMFHTLLSLDYMDKEFKIHDDVKEAKKLIVKDTLDDTNIIRQKKLIQSAIPDFKDLSIEGFKSYLSRYYSMSPEEIEICLSKPADIILPYLIGEYTAFELYKIYEQDPEYAIYLYDKILRIKVDTAEEYFRQIESLGLELGSSVHSFVRKIKD